VDQVDRKDSRVDKGGDAGSSRMMVVDMKLAIIVYGSIRLDTQRDDLVLDWERRVWWAPLLNPHFSDLFTTLYSNLEKKSLGFRV